MIKSFLSGLVVVICMPQLLAQNLVPNPYFDTMVNANCDAGFSGCKPLDYVKYANGWSSFGGTPDYYNSCSYYAGVPQNDFGYQNAVTGNAYCGLIAGPFNYREFIGAQLITPLIAGNKYIGSLMVSRADSCSYATNYLGMSFSLTPPPYICIDTSSSTNYAMVYDTSVISDTGVWTTISGSFVADSDYAYVIVGNFFSDTLTDTVFEGKAKFDAYAYYYIGYVSVTLDTTTGINNVAKDMDISIYPNPSSGIFHISFTEKITAMQVFDVEGRLVMENNEPINNNNAVINLEGKAKGVYFLRATAADGII